MDYVHLIMTLEEQFMEDWIGEHLAYEESLTHDGVTNGGGEVLQHSPYQLLEDKKHFGGEECLAQDNGNIHFCFIFLL